MRMSRSIARWAIVCGALLLPGIAGNFQAAEPARKLPPKSTLAWTFAEAFDELKVNPRDPYLQYITLVLAPGQKEKAQVVGFLEQRIGLAPRTDAENRSSRINLLNSSGRSADVQEVLQFDLLSAGIVPERPATPNQGEAIEVEQDVKEKGDDADPPANAPVAPEVKIIKKDPDTKDKPATPVAKPIDSDVKTSELKDHAYKSTDWTKLLAGRKPAVSELSLCVPSDFFLFECKSAEKFQQELEFNSLLLAFFYHQALRESVSQQFGPRLRKQLALELNPQLLQLLGLVGGEIAVTGSDAFLGDGSDTTLLVRFNQPQIFPAQIEASLASFRKQHPEARSTSGSYQGVKYEHLASPDRTISLVSAFPREGLMIRSNSLIAFERVIDAIRGKNAQGVAVERLGETAEYQYYRTLLPRDANREDWFGFMPTRYLAQETGVQRKLGATQRIRCRNHLAMIGRAALLYQTQYGVKANSLADLEAGGCCPGQFGAADLKCPHGGTYTLTKDGLTATCSHHGSLQQMIPACELPITTVSAAEAKSYRDFFSSASKTELSPIAEQVSITPEKIRTEWVLSPMVGNPLAIIGLGNPPKNFWGTPASLDQQPITRNTILSLAIKFDKDSLVKELPQGGDLWPFSDTYKPHNVIIRKFITEGIGNQFSLNFCDSYPAVDISPLEIVGGWSQLMSGIQKAVPREVMGFFDLSWSYYLLPLNYPAYLSVSVENAAVVDRFLEAVDKAFNSELRDGSLSNDSPEMGGDFYKLTLSNQMTCRCVSIKFSSLKLRFFWARIGKRLYIATRKEMLEELACTEKEPVASDVKPAVRDAESRGHVMLRIQPRNWQRVLSSYRLGWAENNHRACHHNISPLNGVARALRSSQLSTKDAGFGATVQHDAHRMCGVLGYCPDGGHYHTAPDGTHIECSLHGSPIAPRQGVTPYEQTAVGEWLRRLQDVTINVTLHENRIHVHATIDRLPPQTPQKDKAIPQPR